MCHQFYYVLNNSFGYLTTIYYLSMVLVFLLITFADVFNTLFEIILPVAICLLETYI